MSKDDFLSCLKASKVIAPEQLDQVLADIASDDAKQIAIELVRKKLLTKWQAKYLVAGHSRLHVGNYRLLERLRRDEFGDRFLAVHEQLDRLVEIQILPKELNSQPELRETFLNSASVASKVDHPNLVHVYDIDQEGKRLYLVVEHTQGDLLSTFDPVEFAAMDIARLVKQSLLGLRAAHEHGIVHGQINNDNVIVTKEEQVKIQNLVMASLENPEHANASQADDIQAVGKLGHQLLKCLESKNDGRPKLAAIIESVESAEPGDVTRILGELESWIENNDTSSSQTVISAIAIETTVVEAAKPAAAGNVKDQDEDDKRPESVPTQSFLQKQNPVKVIGVAATICLSVLGGVTWLAFFVSQSTIVAEKTTVKKPLTTSAAIVTTQNRPSLKSTGELNRPAKRLGPLTESQPKELTPEEIKAAVEKIGIDVNADSTAAANAESPDEIPADIPNGEPAESAPAIDSAPPMPAAAEDTAEISEPRPAAAKADLDAEKPTAAAQPKEPKKTPKDFEKPFGDFPRYTDLGNIADASPHTIGPVSIPPNVLMAVEIVSSKAISKSKFFFELERSPEDKQRWIVNFRKRKASPPVKVGEFFKKDDTFNFQWDPAAAENDSHNYLRNCALKLTGHNEKVTFLNLRGPVEIEGLVITPENATVKVETDIQWLPNPESLKIEVIPLPYTGIPKSFMYPPHRQIEKRQPVLVFFTDQQKKRFFYLQVSADTKKTLKLQSALMFNPLDGSNAQVADPQLIERVGKQVTQLAMVTNAEYAQIKDAERPSDIKYDDFEAMKKDYKKAAETAQAQKVTLLEYADIIPKLYGKTIPLRVYFEMENMQIELAKSSPNE